MAVHIRPLLERDLEGAMAASAAAFGFDVSGAERTRRWRARLAHPLATDPHGAFAAESADGTLVGVAEAIVREGLWCLSLLTVLPGAQEKGVGRALLEAASGYEPAAGARIIVSSDDPRALWLYATAGFSMRPALAAEGPLDRSRLPRPDARIRAVGPRDIEALASISRDVRGAAHTPELEHMLEVGEPLLRLGDRGFACAGHLGLLAARDEEAAQALLWAALSEQDPTLVSVGVRWITAGQDWAVDVVTSAGLRLATFGALCTQGLTAPLQPYLPSPAFA